MKLIAKPLENKKKSVYAALEETDNSFYYLICFSWFFGLIVNVFWRNVALAPLVSATLLFAMLANLILCRITAFLGKALQTNKC